MAKADLKDCPDEWRQEFTEDEAEWSDTRTEGQKDMRYVSGDPWDQADRTAREKTGRLCLTSDELGQYVNQAINDLRQNKRGIRVSPMALGANAQTSAFRQALIRQIEYRSNAQQAYMVMAENMFQRGYGCLRIVAKFAEVAGDEATPAALNQELWIDPVVNPDMVTPDPYATRSDGSDMNRLWYRESWAKDDFLRKWPDATINPALITADVAKSWVTHSRVTVAEKWVKERSGSKTLYLLKDPDGKAEPTAVWGDDLPKPPKSESIAKKREIDQFQVKKYLTNGLQILEENRWPGTSIPWVTCFGKILYVESKRQILSMVRLARDPYMLYCYMVTCQGEIVGAIPRNAWIGYKGQFHNPLEWQAASHEPKVYLEANALTEATGGQVLPLPQRQPWDPPLQNIEIAKEAARRAIQAAMGVSPLPTNMQRDQRLSGRAQDKLEASTQKGVFHFVDHFDDAICRTGALLDELIPHYYDTARDVSIRKPDDSPIVVRINDPSKKYSAKLEESSDAQDTHISADQGVHDVTISVAPAETSEREANSDFADNILQNKEMMALMGPEKAKKLAALAVKLKGVGPFGDAIADLLDPPQGKADPMQAQQAMAENQHLKQQLGQAAQMIQNKTAEKRMELASKENIAKFQAQADQMLSVRLQAMKDATSIAVAKINASVKIGAAANEAEMEAIALAHEAELQMHTQAHERGLAELAQQHALEQGDAEHVQALEQADQGHHNALEQGAQAAALQPPTPAEGAPA